MKSLNTELIKLSAVCSGLSAFIPSSLKSANKQERSKITISALEEKRLGGQVCFTKLR